MLMLPRCSVALSCFNVTYQGGTQVPNYLEVIDIFQPTAVPAGVERFFAVYEFKDGTPGVYTTKLRVDGPDGFSHETRTMDISFTTEMPNARIAIEVRQFVFPCFGRYRFAFLLSDQEAGHFTIDVKQGSAASFFLPPKPGG